jgi:hypothetical protein
MTRKSENMAATKVKDKVHADLEDEMKKMVLEKAFLDERDEFSPMVRAYADKSQKTEDDGWNLLTAKIIEVLPKYLTDGMITCSLERISQEGPCRNAAESNEAELTLSPGDNFPKIPFPTFYPYLDFILQAGPVDVFHMKTNFKVEGSIQLDEAKIRFKEKKVQKVTGTIMVSATISLCKGDFAKELHNFKKKIEVA